MADFRKWFLAFAVVALMLGASMSAHAQVTGAGSITCNVTPSNVTVVSVEGITEPAGDIVMVCTGGTPTPSGQRIPQIDLTVTANTNITSRLQGGGTGFIDVLAVIDEAWPAPAATPFVTPGLTASAFRVGGSPSGQRVCFANTLGGATNVPPFCNILNGTFNPVTFLFAGNPYDPLGPNGAGAFNVFVASATANPAQVVFKGLPVDAPGTAGSRVIRITNIHVNACQSGLASGLIPNQVIAFLAINGSSNIVINGTGQAVIAQVQTGLLVSGGNTSLQQCNNLNVGFVNGSGSIGGNFFGSPFFGIAVTSVRVTEGYPASFKRRIAAQGVVTDVFDGNNTPGPLQNVPGFNYFSYTMFQPLGAFTGGTPFGEADAGTRILLRFNNIGTGVSVILPQFVALTIDNVNPGAPNPASAVGPWTGGFLELVPGANGGTISPLTAVASFSNSSFFFSSGPFKGPGAVAPFNNAFALGVVANSASAVYEVGNADPAATETGNIPIGIAYAAATNNNQPTPGQSTVNVSFSPLAPLPGQQVAESGDSIPRYCDRSTPINSWKISVCQCNLLFPFVTAASLFDTGIAVANTTMDPYGTLAQTGPVTFFFYGTVAGGGTLPAALATQTTNANVPAGTDMVFTLFSGGQYGIQGVPGFQGYMIAVANFQFCHGFAFISDLGAQKLAEGYLAIQLDFYGGTGLNRTGVVGEVQGH